MRSSSTQNVIPPSRGRPQRFGPARGEPLVCLCRAMTMVWLVGAALGFAACGQDPGGDPDPDATASGDAGVPDAADAARSDAAAGADATPDPDSGIPPDPADPGPEAAQRFTADAALDVGGETVTLPVVVHAPDTAGPHPVVVFTHGFQLSPADYESYGEHLATWGYLTVMPELPGGLFDAPTHRELKESLRGLLDWLEAHASDPAGPLEGLADPTTLAMAGHSMGGKLSLLVATEDDRPDAVFGVDPVDAGGGPTGGDPVDYPSVTPELMPDITVPLVLLGETVNATAGGMGQACAPADQNFQQYYEHAVSPALEIEVIGANHMSFLDDPNCGLACSVCPAGTDDPATTRRITQRYLTAFLQVFLRQQPAFRHYLTGPGMDADEAAGLVTTRTKNGF